MRERERVNILDYVYLFVWISSKFQAEDELIFKEKINSFKKQEPGKEKELGKSYLKSIRDSIAKHKQLA